eukprot:TRINITY_DN439_c0_g1_i1.p1 TRINITY_DN439_c0_g1~~TRINITY_DN439_c0_g1_i1.p1  ORF type:complete len:306 (+),score=75.13 TRINITY_DN439_c0_g1_i1:789-1706(+)
MYIEADARRYITEAIEIERDLKSLEVRERAKGRILIDIEEYHQHRSRLVRQMTSINGVANAEGKGREDLTIDILLAAEGIIRRISPAQSRAVRNLAQSIRDAFTGFRELLRRFDQNIEVVDPQLKNNPDLVEALVRYENSWEKGKSYFLDGRRCAQVIHISQFLEGLCEKHPLFAEQVECRDAAIFVTIPCLLLLKLLEGDDKDICAFFLPELLDPEERCGRLLEELRTWFTKCRTFFASSFEYHNFLEKMIIGVTLAGPELELYRDERVVPVDNVLNRMKQLSIELQRNKPMEFNDFLDIVLGS